MTTALQQYATRDSMITVVRWIGSESSYKMIREWLKEDVWLSSSNELHYLSDDGFEQLPSGHYLAKINDSIIAFSPEELQEDYVKVSE